MHNILHWIALRRFDYIFFNFDEFKDNVLFFQNH